jgi:hypothetical protein
MWHKPEMSRYPTSITRAGSYRAERAIDADDGWTLPQPDGTLRWDEVAITRLLDTDGTDVLFFAGCEENMVAFLPRFDIVVLLSAPRDVIVHRIADRSGGGVCPRSRRGVAGHPR